jgi:hypothetical protein
MVRGSIPWGEIPEHVEGVFLVGCGVAFPDPQIHCYATPIHRGTGINDDLEVASIEPNQGDLAVTILELFERSSGIRPTLLQVGSRVILRRDGAQRIWPFNLLMSADHPTLGREATSAPWMR